MADIDLDGQTYFHDRTSRRELMNRLAVQVDLERAVFVVGTASDDRASELVFDDPATRRAVTQVVDAMRRHAYRHRPVQAVPKPRRRCDLCGDTRTIRNPHSQELFRCPACG